MKHRSAGALAIAIAITACDPGRSGDVISREQFIRASVAVRAVPDTVKGADSLRARALRREKVTPAQLRAWVRVHERDGKVMSETWREIVRRVDAASPKPPIAPPGSSPPLPEMMRVPPPPTTQPPPQAAPPVPPTATPTPPPDGRSVKGPKAVSRDVEEAPPPPTPVPGAPDVTRPVGPPVPDSAGRPRG